MGVPWAQMGDEKFQEKALLKLLELWRHEEKSSEEAARSLATESSKAILALSSAAIGLAIAWKIRQPEILSSKLSILFSLSVFLWGIATVAMASLFHVSCLAYRRRHTQADRNIAIILSDLNLIDLERERGETGQIKLSSKPDSPDTSFNKLILCLNLTGIVAFLMACLMVGIFAWSITT